MHNNNFFLNIVIFLYKINTFIQFKKKNIYIYIYHVYIYTKSKIPSNRTIIKLCAFKNKEKKFEAWF